MARPELTVELSKLNLISRIKETIFQSLQALWYIVDAM